MNCNNGTTILIDSSLHDAISGGPKYKNTNIPLNSGESFCIQIEGSVYWNGLSTPPRTIENGGVSVMGSIFPSSNEYIVSTGHQFMITNNCSYSGIASNSGFLFLAPYDTLYTDNSGSYTACIKTNTYANICEPCSSNIGDMCNDYTKFNNIESLNDHQLINHLEENIKTFLDWGFLNIGAFINVKIPNSGLFGGNFSDLKSSDQPGYNPGQVWQSAKKEWVWETGVAYKGTSPTPISGVYVSNTFYPAPTGSGNIGYNINYPLGQIIFNKPLASSTPVKLEYSYRWCQVLKGGANEFLTELQGATFAPNPAINNKNKGEYQISANHRIQMPCIIIEPIARSYSKPWQMGSHDFAVDQDLLLHVFAENYQDKIKIADIIRFQKEKVIYLYDINKVVKSGLNPLDYKGSLNTNGKNYYDLVTNSEYRWNKCFFKDISLTDMESVNKNLYWCTLRLTAEVIL